MESEFSGNCCTSENVGQSLMVFFPVLVTSSQAIVRACIPLLAYVAFPKTTDAIATGENKISANKRGRLAGGGKRVRSIKTVLLCNGLET